MEKNRQEECLLALPLGSPFGRAGAERLRGLGRRRRGTGAAIASLSQRTCLSLRSGSRETGLPSQSRSARQLPQRGSPWQAGPLPTGRLSPDMAQKGGPCYRGQRQLDKRTLSSCRESWQRSTTVSEKIRLCSFRVGLTGTPEAPPLGELSPKVTERARTPTESFSVPFCSKNFLKIHFIGLLFCYTPVRTKRHRREEE